MSATKRRPWLEPSIRGCPVAPPERSGLLIVTSGEHLADEVNIRHIKNLQDLMDYSSCLVLTQEFAQGAKKLSVSRTDSMKIDARAIESALAHGRVRVSAKGTTLCGFAVTGCCRS